MLLLIAGLLFFRALHLAGQLALGGLALFARMVGGRFRTRKAAARMRV
jgi:hypothetical protein